MTQSPQPDVAGARERLALLADVCVAFPHQGATELTIRGDDLKETAEDLRLILSAYDRQGEALERIELCCGQGDTGGARQIAREALAARARQGGPDHG